MPLDPHTRDSINQYVFRDIVPKTVMPRPNKPIHWFEEQFSFIQEDTLRRYLGEAFYQARYVGRLREALDLKGGFNNPFTKYQIVLYASIYEAIIDHFLEAKVDDPILKDLLSEVVYKKQGNAFSSKIKLMLTEDSVDHELIPCRIGKRVRKLKEIQFDQRVEAAVKLGIVLDDDSAFIKTLYKSRNNVHLQSSAVKKFTPNGEESSEAFRLLFRFIDHLRNRAF